MKALEIRPRVQECLDEFIKDQRPTLNKVSPSLDPLADFAHEFLSGGKRLRAAFCYWGYIGAGGKDCQEIISAATALELLQACALVHDDVMDASDTRRGKPSIHKRFETMHQDSKWLGDKKQFGGGDDSQILQSYTNYGLPLGEAFQLRDDVLGVFGDPSETGKPAGDDLREGKRTVLIEMTYQKANSGQKQILDDNFGKDLDLAGVEKVREVVTQTGALGEVENMISSLFDQSQKALAEANITAQAKEAFSELALAATSRRV